MLEPLFGSKITEKILLFLLVYGTGYIREIARLFNFNVNAVAFQLDRLENGGVIVSQMKGKIRLYSLNPRYFFLNELKALLQKAKDALPEEEVEK
jgi:predicted transcriptional regulator